VGRGGEGGEEGCGRGWGIEGIYVCVDVDWVGGWWKGWLCWGNWNGSKGG